MVQFWKDSFYDSILYLFKTFCFHPPGVIGQFSTIWGILMMIQISNSIVMYFVVLMYYYLSMTFSKLLMMGHEWKC